MPPNTGRIGAMAGTDVAVYVYYDNTNPADPSQPLINGPRGFCLDVTNTSGRPTRVEVTSPNGTITATIQRGDPVTTGQARSRTAAQMAQAGFTTRGDVQGISLAFD